MNLGPILTAFPGKVRVTFIHADSLDIIGIDKIKAEKLPHSFNKPTHIEWKGVEWRVLKAEPADAKQFKINNRLTLHVQDTKLIDPKTFGFDIPSICIDLPDFTNGLHTEEPFIHLSKDNWRQLEFFPLSLLDRIQKHMVDINEKLYPGGGTNTLLGYKNIHSRTKVQERLGIPLSDFSVQASIHKIGAVIFSENKIVKNCISLYSENYIYYSIIEDNIMIDLCISSFECVDEEFYKIVSTYNLGLADWCNGKIITA